MEWLELVLFVAIVVRVTLLVTRDDLFAGVRRWADRLELADAQRVYDRRGVRPGETTVPHGWTFGWWVGKVTGCAWCASPYIAAGAWAWWAFLPADWFLGAGLVCAGSLAAGLVGEWLE